MNFHSDQEPVKVLKLKKIKTKSCRKTLSSSSGKSVPTGKLLYLAQLICYPYYGEVTESVYDGRDNVLLAPTDCSIPKIRVTSCRIAVIFDKRVVVIVGSFDFNSNQPTSHAEVEIS